MLSLLLDDVCSEKDNISLLIDDTVHTVELTDIQVLQQLLDRELNGGSLTSSAVLDKRNVTPMKNTARIIVPPQPSLPTVNQLQSSVPRFIETSEMLDPHPSSRLITASTSSLPTTSYLQSSQTIDIKSQHFVSSDITKDASSVSTSSSLNSFSSSSTPVESSNSIRPTNSLFNPSQSTKYIPSQIIQSSFLENLKLNSHEIVTPIQYRISSNYSQISSNYVTTRSTLHDPISIIISNLTNPSVIKSSENLISSENVVDTETVEQTSSTAMDNVTTIQQSYGITPTTSIKQPSRNLNSNNAESIEMISTGSQMDYMISPTSTPLMSHHTMIVEQSSILSPFEETISRKRSDTILSSRRLDMNLSSRKHSDVIITETSQFTRSSEFEEATGFFNVTSSDIISTIESTSRFNNKEIHTTTSGLFKVVSSLKIEPKKIFNKEIHSTRKVELSKGELTSKIDPETIYASIVELSKGTPKLSSKFELETHPSKEIHSTSNELFKSTTAESSSNIIEMIPSNGIHSTTSINTQSLYTQHEQIQISSQLTTSKESIQVKSKEQLYQSTLLEIPPMSIIQETPRSFESKKTGMRMRTKQIKDEYTTIAKPPSLRSNSKFSYEEEPPQPPEDISSRQKGTQGVYTEANTHKQFRELSTMSELHVSTTTFTYKEFLDSSSISNALPSNSNSINTEESRFEVFPSTKTFLSDSYLITTSNSEQHSDINKITPFKSIQNLITSDVQVTDSSFIVPTSNTPILVTSAIQPTTSTISKFPESSKSTMVPPKRKCKTCEKFFFVHCCLLEGGLIKFV